MVFCGKPSGGCHACRARKTRCDKVPEGCSQCKKAKRVCPGYRKQGDLIFRDESSNVVHKFKAREAREAKKMASAPVVDTTRSQEDVPLDSRETSPEVVQQQDSPMPVRYAVAPTLEDRATGFFIFHYVLGMHGPSKGHFYNLLTNAALNSPEDVTKDSTLMAIHILSIFETVTGCRQRSLKDWSEHLHGAAAVIKLQSPWSKYKILYYHIIRNFMFPLLLRPEKIPSFALETFMNVQNLTLPLRSLTSQLMIACLQDNRRLPAYIREYMDAAVMEIKTPEPAFVIQQCMMQYTDLNSDIHNKVITDPEAIISKCLEIDGFLLAIATNVPDGWEFETVYTDVDSDFVYNGRYDVYYDYWIAQMWNALRTLRVMLNEQVRNTLLAGFSSKPPYFTEPQYTAQFQISTELLYQVQDDVLGTVVQHMGRPLSKDPRASSNKETWELGEIGTGHEQVIRSMINHHRIAIIADIKICSPMSGPTWVVFRASPEKEKGKETSRSEPDAQPGLAKASRVTSRDHRLSDLGPPLHRIYHPATTITITITITL
ncbi:hypothetical protein LAWI1_G000600 [Lachnellula willkommii]|uniref:Zn(2)-C6 fungal-type domain-containing protein n=1 Tax=Lachnellula willkommii TaxID=215461 RepID=A0A559MN40_9HELO|nr:hypothetical protein LAWI1_G000600 [Lachnellula willkommii]